MSYEQMYMMEDALESVVSVSSFGTMVSVASYVFTALALYTIAKRREIRNPWMAWVPLLNVWILGSISDQYRYVVRNEVRSKRKVLLTVSILQFVATTAAIVKVIASVVMAVTGMAQSIHETELIRLILSSLAFFIPVAILAILSLVFRILALYDVFTSCDPANNILYLILSLIPYINTVTQPLFLFLCREKDGGMPPRRDAEAEKPADYNYTEL